MWNIGIVTVNNIFFSFMKWSVSKRIVESTRFWLNILIDIEICIFPYYLQSLLIRWPVVSEFVIYISILWFERWNTLIDGEQFPLSTKTKQGKTHHLSSASYTTYNYQNYFYLTGCHSEEICHYASIWVVAYRNQKKDTDREPRIVPNTHSNFFQLENQWLYAQLSSGWEYESNVRDLEWKNVCLECILS